MKEVNNQNLWNFELCSQESMKVPKWIIIGFQQRERQDSGNLVNDSFYRLPVTSTRCIIGTEKYPVAGILLNYHGDDYSHGYSQIKETFGALTKNDILQLYISDDVFRSSNAGVVNIGYKLNIFDSKYQQNFTSSQRIKVKFKFNGVVPSDVNGYALLLTNKIVSISSDGRRHFHLN